MSRRASVKIRGNRRPLMMCEGQASIFDFKVSFDVERCGFYRSQSYALARILKVWGKYRVNQKLIFATSNALHKGRSLTLRLFRTDIILWMLVFEVMMPCKFRRNIPLPYLELKQLPPFRRYKMQPSSRFYWFPTVNNYVIIWNFYFTMMF